MGIYIPNMEMPSNRRVELLVFPNGYVGIYDVRGRYLANARAVPLPEGHGRLIDADAVVKTICNSCDGACDVVQCDCLNCKADCRCDIVKEISDAPTIIEADIEWKMKNCCCFSNTDPAEGGTDDDGNA